MIHSTIMNLQDSDRHLIVVPMQFGQAPSPLLCATTFPSIAIDLVCGVILPSEPTSYVQGGTSPSSPGSPRNGTIGPINHKGRQCGADNLVDIVKDFNPYYFSIVKMQEMRDYKNNDILIVDTQVV